MEFGLGLTNYRGCWDDVAFAEAHGFTSAGFFDTPLTAHDPFVAMTMAASRTSKIRLGTFLNIPSLRSAPAAANAISTINLIAPGRIFFATGSGYSSRLPFGLPPMPVGRVVDYIAEIRALWSGSEVEHQHGAHPTRIRLANREQLRNNAENPIPIYLAADGPRGLRAVGRHADGWITTLQNGGELGVTGAMGNSAAVFAEAFTNVLAAAAEAGRPFDASQTHYSSCMCVLRSGESVLSPRVLRIAGPLSMFAFHSYACSPEIREFLPPVLRDRIDIYETEVLAKLDVPRDRLYQAVHDGHLDHLLDGEAAVLTEEIIRMMTLTGTPEEIAGQVHALESAGLKHLNISVPHAYVRDMVLDVEQKIVPLLEPLRSDAVPTAP